MSSTLRKGMLFGMGNPLLDISATVENDFLTKYSLKPNDAILADEKHAALYTELVEKYDCSYIAGGATQNTLRVFQWVVQVPEVSTFMGCIGHDKFGGILEQKAKEAGVNVRYQYSDKEATGTCAVLLTDQGRSRSLCANLAAAQLYSSEHLCKPDNKALMEEASHYYISGFFLSVSLDSILTVAKHACSKGKTFCMNLSAPFLCRIFKEQMMQAFPYIDILFGNETEAREFADVHNLGTTDTVEIAKLISKFPKESGHFERMVVITQGAEDVIVAQGNDTQTFPVPKLKTEDIVDTNGAGDAFVGGFLAMYLLGKPIETCVRCGITVSVEVIKKSGCTLPDRESVHVV
uniref:Adenosine kinase n=1 Tax=Ixodes ricinus TaxID=34613 RepID=A0A131XX10_IXORI